MVQITTLMDGPINGHILHAKISQLARKIKIKNLKCFASWIQRFGQRHNIGIGNISGESSTILILKFVRIGSLTFGHPFEQVNSTIKCIMLIELAFLQINPRYNSTLQGEKHSSTKLSKERITVFMAAETDKKNSTLLESRKSLGILKKSHHF